VVAVVGLAAALLAACGDDDGGDAEGTGSDGGAGLANPASVFCEQQGGTVEIVTADDGSQSGMCQLADGTEVDEWQYFREYHTDSDDETLANPAALYCEEQGGTTTGDEPLCELPDGEVVDAWQYYRQQTAGGASAAADTPSTGAGSSTSVAPVVGGYYGG